MYICIYFCVRVFVLSLLDFLNHRVLRFFSAKTSSRHGTPPKNEFRSVLSETSQYILQQHEREFSGSFWESTFQELKGERAYLCACLAAMALCLC